MTETMLEKDGVGLAAPQIGINERLVIINFQLTPSEFRPIALINPEIVDASIEMIGDEEGCLSLPGENATVVRPAKVTVRFLDENNNKRILELEKLNARAVQHEIDHLDGILFVDRAESKIQNIKINLPEKIL